MKIMADFACEQCGIFERYVDAGTHDITCDCGCSATRLMGAPTVKLEGITGDFPGAHDRWARIREENARIKAKRSYAGE